MPPTTTYASRALFPKKTGTIIQIIRKQLQQPSLQQRRLLCNTNTQYSSQDDSPSIGCCRPCLLKPKKTIYLRQDIRQIQAAFSLLPLSASSQSHRSFHSSRLVSEKAGEDREAAPEPSTADTVAAEYSTEELTKDAARHKAGLQDPNRPGWQNPLQHENPDLSKTFPEDFDSPEDFQKATVPAPPLTLEGEENKVAAPDYLHEMADEIVHLTMLEMNELINKIADHYDFHEGMLSPDDDEAGDADDDEDDEGQAVGGKEEAKTAFDIKLVDYDKKAKIKVIKEVRSIVTGLGLKEAKELVEGAPAVIQKDLKEEEAKEVKDKLEALGATVEIV